MAELILPRIFEDKSPDGKYKHLNGAPKISYSQINSWVDPLYHADYLKNYFLKISLPSGIFAEFGSACGEYIESKGVGTVPNTDRLCDTDVEILGGIEYPENSIYEDLIVIDMGEFVIEGYADRCIYLPENELIVEDFKTGSIAKKGGFYASQDYMQTKLYAFEKENLGYKIKDCKVLMLDRAGNGSEKHPIRLTGKTQYIPTPYNRKEVEKYLKKIKFVAKDISDCYQTYLKIFG